MLLLVWKPHLNFSILFPLEIGVGTFPPQHIHIVHCDKSPSFDKILSSHEWKCTKKLSTRKRCGKNLRTNHLMVEWQKLSEVFRTQGLNFSSKFTFYFSPMAKWSEPGCRVTACSCNFIASHVSSAALSKQLNIRYIIIYFRILDKWHAMQITGFKENTVVVVVVVSFRPHRCSLIWVCFSFTWQTPNHPVTAAVMKQCCRETARELLMAAEVEMWNFPSVLCSAAQDKL